MISNYEFIKTQAYELSWAVFRCTELFTQDKLRKEVEAAAVDLITDSGTIAETMESEFPRIEKLTSLIRLAESVGQIASVNANVLYRELDNLTKAIRLEIVDRREKKNITASLDRMFTNAAYASQLGNTAPTDVAQPGNTSSASSLQVNSAAQKKEDAQFGSIEQLLSAATKSSQPINRGADSTVSASANPIAQFIQPAQAAPQPNQPIRQSVPTTPSSALRQTQDVVVSTVAPMNAPIRQVQVATTGSWQNVILQKVKDLGQTTTKELTASFPEISERTIRFYLQKLVDNGAIDRIGTTGPGAAYRAK